ncbi:MAG TPA: ribosome silencing factor [Terriglobales bacterium]|nr:ribosome silencing factor [Terriglobales bacterium]
MARTKTNTNQTRQQLVAAVAAAESRKAEDVAILELDKHSGAFTDYFLICSGSNPRQIQAIADAVDEQLGQSGLRPTHVEGYTQAEWILLDYVDFVVHIFSTRARNFYNLERLWKSAMRMNAAEFAAAAAAATRKRAPRKLRSAAPAAKARRTRRPKKK